MRLTTILCMILLVGTGTACADSESSTLDDDLLDSTSTVLPAPAATWQEHWLEHEQLLSLQFDDENLVVYFDEDVDSTIVWPDTLMAEVWTYVKELYGDFGNDPRLFTVFHTGKYSGGHPATYFDETHDYHNTIDCGPYTWERPLPQEGLSMLVHEIGHIVEGGSKGVKESPAFDIWGDSKWAEIFIYDVYLGLGLTDYADQLYAEMVGNTDDFPNAGTHWFRDWFYPIYSRHGESTVLNKYFELLAEYFPKTENAIGYEYDRRMNWGEFIHFWSGAAGKDLRPIAEDAFEWQDEWSDQLYEARVTFPDITYDTD